MTDYRLYRLDGAGRIGLAEWLEASDDDDALRQANNLTKEATKCELWEGRRLVATSDKHRLIG